MWGATSVAPALVILAAAASPRDRWQRSAPQVRPAAVLLLLGGWRARQRPRPSSSAAAVVRRNRQAQSTPLLLGGGSLACRHLARSTASPLGAPTCSCRVQMASDPAGGGLPPLLLLLLLPPTCVSASHRAVGMPRPGPSPLTFARLKLRSA